MDDKRDLAAMVAEVKTLPAAAQDRIGEVLQDAIAQERFDVDMQDPEYAAYMEEAVRQGMADIAAGRVMSFEEAAESVLGPDAMRLIRGEQEPS